MQVLFEWDFNGNDGSHLEDSMKRVVSEFGPGLEDTEFVESLILGVVKEKEKIDRIIEKAAPDWPINQIAVVDRNILRMGLFELIFGNRSDVPAKVAINEAIELAKTFGGENSGRFVNGVLGTIYKEMGEPGKDEVPAKKKRIKDIPFEEMPIERLGGAVIYTKEKSQIYLALVHDVFGYWTLSKGHLEEGEDLKEAIKREIKQELSVEVEPETELGTNEYIASDPEKGKIRKQVTYFLSRASSKDTLELEKKGGLDNASWFKLEEVGELKMYDDIVPIITKAIKILLSH